MTQANDSHPASPKIMVGTRPEVIQLLRCNEAQRALAIAFGGPDDEQLEMLEDLVRQVAEFFPQLVRQRQNQALEKIVNALLPEVAIPDVALAQARMMVDAKTTILKSGDLVTASDIAKLAGYSANNPSAQPNRWKREGAIFAIHYKGTDYFPMYALDPDENYRPYKALAEVLRTFGETKDSWGLAFWFAGLNSFLDDERPQDLLGTHPEQVIAAARDEVEGVQHG
jgi:hypothetical protein